MSGGRPSDPIRSFFLKIEGTKMKCIDCNTYVSDKTERLRSHRKRCNSIHITQKGQKMKWNVISTRSLNLNQSLLRDLKRVNRKCRLIALRLMLQQVIN